MTDWLDELEQAAEGARAWYIAPPEGNVRRFAPSYLLALIACARALELQETMEKHEEECLNCPCFQWSLLHPQVVPARRQALAQLKEVE